MKLTYKSNKLYNLCELVSSNKDIVKKYGSQVSQKLPLRIEQLKNFSSLNDIPSVLPFRRYKLDGKFKGCYAINITNQYRLIFKPLNLKMNDLSMITDIEILEVSKHYE